MHMAFMMKILNYFGAIKAWDSTFLVFTHDNRSGGNCKMRVKYLGFYTALYNYITLKFPSISHGW